MKKKKKNLILLRGDVYDQLIQDSTWVGYHIRIKNKNRQLDTEYMKLLSCGGMMTMADQFRDILFRRQLLIPGFQHLRRHAKLLHDLVFDSSNDWMFFRAILVRRGTHALVAKGPKVHA